MRRTYQTASLMFIALGLYLMWESQRLKFYSDVGPGPGFFPFWLGFIITILAAVWLGQVSFKPVENMAEGFIPNRSGILRILAILGALVLFTLATEYIGFQLTMFAFLLFLLVALGRQNPVVTLAVSIIGSFGLYYAFRHWLDVQLPASSIEFLQHLGL